MLDRADTPPEHPERLVSTAVTFGSHFLSGTVLDPGRRSQGQILNTHFNRGFQLCTLIQEKVS